MMDLNISSASPFKQTTSTLVSSSSLLVALLLAVISWYCGLHFFQSNINAPGKQEKELVVDDPYAIDPCPNPNCVRCQKYAVVNRNALRKLPWLQKQQDQHQQQSSSASATANTISATPSSISIDRVVMGVKLGRRQSRFSNSSKDDVGLSPAQGQYPTVLLIPNLVAMPMVTHLHIEACRYLEHHVDILRDEYNHVVSQHEQSLHWLENDIGKKSSTAPWTVLHLLNQGKWMQENVALFPQTFQIMTRRATARDDSSNNSTTILPIMPHCIFGNIFLSRVQPGSYISPHCGPTNARHRLHLTLFHQTRTTSTRNNHSNVRPVLRVRDETMTWQVDQAMVFDDSLVHSVEYKNSTSTRTTSTSGNSSSAVEAKLTMDNAEKETAKEEQQRIVWIVDLWHSDLTPSERQTITDLYPAA
jgi:Aspartyl/Asparaginyl beta-hydroxylase